MKTILVITENVGFSEAIQASLESDEYRVISQPDIQRGDRFASSDQLDACILDGDLTSVLPIRKIESLTRILPLCPLIVYTQSSHLDWEEEAYVLGVMHILTKPVRAQMLHSILASIWKQRAPRRPARIQSPYDHPAYAPAPAATPQPRPEPRMEGGNLPQNALEALRNFSGLLPHGLSIEDLLKQFLLLLRETVAVNRASIYLKLSPDALRTISNESGRRKLASAFALGLQPGLRQQLVLSLDSGVGELVARECRIIRRDVEWLKMDEQTRREFDLLGAEVALPILDRESIMGVAFFDRHLTGDPLGREELNLIFYMLEGLGMAVKNIWLHQEVSSNWQLLGDILGELKSGCMVIGSDLSIMHANKSATAFFAKTGSPVDGLKFRDLPHLIGSKVYELLQGAPPQPPFRYTPPNMGGRVFRVAITPFGRKDNWHPEAAMLLVEDSTQDERLQQMEIEAANLRMVKTMAERLAHEIGNAVVPLSTHQQLLATNFKDPEFRVSLEAAMLDGVKRIARLGQQMLFLAQDHLHSSEQIPVGKLIEEAFREAQKNHGEQTVVLQYETGGRELVLNGDKAGLKHALAEIMLNALQANPPRPR